MKISAALAISPIVNHLYSTTVEAITFSPSFMAEHHISIGTQICIIGGTLADNPTYGQVIGTCIRCNPNEIEVDADVRKRLDGSFRVMEGVCSKDNKNLPVLMDSGSLIKVKIWPKVIAIGDLHSDYDNALATLVMAGVTDHQGHWISGTTVLVNTGDVLDRGDDTIRIIKLMIRLKNEAEEVGGRVVSLLGNHEVSNMKRDWRYVSDADFASFGTKKNRRNAFSAEGWIGAYLRSLKLGVKVNDSIFFHAGPYGPFIGPSIATMNYEAKRELNLIQKFTPRDLLGTDGPLWNRAYAKLSEREVCPQVSRLLQLLGATRLVIAHTPTENGRIRARCGDTLFVIDTGISKVYGSHLSALEILDDEVVALYPTGREHLNI